MNDTLFNWHLTSDKDLPENYRELIRYSFKCSELSPRVLAVTASGKWHILRRVRKITEADFSWHVGGGEPKNLSFNPNIIMWSFLPNLGEINSFINFNDDRE